MVSPQNWAEALKINAEKLSEWSLQAPASVPVLVWCLENGHVSVEDYLAWACEHYGLPVLNSAFFTQSFDRSSLTEETRTSEFWSPWCFPVGQWEDVTLVACVEMPANRPEGNYAYLLADPSAMHEVWGRDESTNSAVAIEAPAGVNLSAQSTFVLNLDSLDLNLGGEVKADEPPQVTEESDQQTLSLAMESTSILNVDDSMDEIVEAKTPTPILKVVPPTPNGSTPPPVKAPAPKTKTKTRILVDDEPEVQAAFTQLRKEYQSALIMKCSHGVAAPYKWDSSLNISAGDDSTHIDLSSPSFFRIVSKTSHPYHGYVVESPLHKAFFKALHLKEAPASVTAIPLFTAGNKLWGILVAFGGESAQGPHTLEHAMKVSEKLTSACAATWGQAA